MLRRVAVIAIAIILTISAITAAKQKRQVRSTKIDNQPIRSLGVRPTLATSDTCIARNDDGIYWRIDGWVIGEELYKRYINPADSCGAPYPFEILGVGIVMHFGIPGTIQLSADIELADMTNPSCPVPGSLVGSASATYEFEILEAGLYDLFVFLDNPITVTAPFFAGMYIANIVDSADLVAVVVDSSYHWPNPLPCWSYNIWDTTIGFIDLVDNEFFNFPGRLIMYAGGIPGTSPPAARFVSHQDDAHITGETILWAQDTSGSNIIDYMSFSYYKVGDPPTEIGQDHDGFSPLRNDSDAALPGDGYGITWDPSGLTAGFYSMEVTAYDSLGRSSTDQILRVVIEPARPTPNITSPATGSDFCNEFDLIMSPSDPGFSSVEVFLQEAQLDYSTGLFGVPAPALDHAAPAAAASAIKHWADNGYPNLMTDINTLVSNLATEFRTGTNSGTFDEDLFAGLYKYQFEHGNNLVVEFMRNPTYFDIRTWAESEQRAVLLGIGGSRGTWLAVDGFKSWSQGIDMFYISVMLPATGTVMDLAMRKSLTTTEIELFGVWERVDIMVSLVPTDLIVSRNTIGWDIIGFDGWEVHVVPDTLQLAEDNLYFFRAEGRNTTNIKDASTILLNYNCSAVFINGDFNGDGVANILDYYILQSHIALNGVPPWGGGHRADTNCDQVVNLADLVFFTNFIFGSIASPCW